MPTPKLKLTDEERHERFKKVAQEVGASEDPGDFDKAFKKILHRQDEASSHSRAKKPEK